MSNTPKQPKFLMDKTGYCYRTTALLLKEGGFEPWDGEVGPDGRAVEGKGSGKKKRSGGRAQTGNKPQPAQPVEPEVAETPEAEVEPEVEAGPEG